MDLTITQAHHGKKDKILPIPPHVQISILEDTIAELAKSKDETEDSRAQMTKASLEKTMALLRRSQADLAMVQDENEILMGDMTILKLVCLGYISKIRCISLHNRKHLT